MSAEVLTPKRGEGGFELPAKTVSALCARGDICPGARKLGRCWRIPRWAIQRLFEEDAQLPVYPGRRPRTHRVTVFAHDRQHERIVEGSVQDARLFEARQRVELRARPSPSRSRAVPAFSTFCAEKYEPHARAHLGADTWSKVRCYQVATLSRLLGRFRVDALRAEHVDAYKRTRLSEKHRGKPVTAPRREQRAGLRVLKTMLPVGPRGRRTSIAEFKFKMLPTSGKRQECARGHSPRCAAFAAAAELYPAMVQVLVFLLNTGCRKGRGCGMPSGASGSTSTPGCCASRSRTPGHPKGQGGAGGTLSGRDPGDASRDRAAGATAGSSWARRGSSTGRSRRSPSATSRRVRRSWRVAAHDAAHVREPLPSAESGSAAARPGAGPLDDAGDGAPTRICFRATWIGRENAVDMAPPSKVWRPKSGEGARPPQKPRRKHTRATSSAEKREWRSPRAKRRPNTPSIIPVSTSCFPQNSGGSLGRTAVVPSAAARFLGTTRRASS